MNLLFFVQQVPDHLRQLARLFVQAFQQGDADHADELINLAIQLERSPEGAAFVADFCDSAVAR